MTRLAVNAILRIKDHVPKWGGCLVYFRHYMNEERTLIRAAFFHPERKHAREHEFCTFRSDEFEIIRGGSA